MLIVLTVVSLLMVAGGIWMFIACYEDGWDTTPGEVAGMLLTIIGFIALIICIVATIITWKDVMKLDVIDAKIEMYTEENTKIETQIADTVQKYMEYETGIFTEVSPESAMTLVALYPELKADALVSRQIDVYVENNNIIKELKADKINGSVLRWWLYFGK